MQQNTPEWLEMRKKHIGASDCPIIMGVSPWKTPIQLWEEKLGLRDPPTMNFAMQRGHDIEPVALKAYNDFTGQNCAPEVVFHKERKYMMASMDGVDFNLDHAVEIKCPGEKDHNLAGEGKIPEKYYPQLQHQLAVIGLDMIDYFSYKDGSFHLVQVSRDEKYIKKIYKAEEIFWNHLKNFTSPDLCDRDYIERKDYEWETVAESWVKANKELKFYKNLEQNARNSLIDISKGKSSIGHGVKLQKIVRKGSVDYSTIPQLVGLNLDDFRKADIETWRCTG